MEIDVELTDKSAKTPNAGGSWLQLYGALSGLKANLKYTSRTVRHNEPVLTLYWGHFCVIKHKGTNPQGSHFLLNELETWEAVLIREI